MTNETRAVHTDIFVCINLEFGICSSCVFTFLHFAYFVRLLFLRRNDKNVKTDLHRARRFADFFVTYIFFFYTSFQNKTRRK